MKFLVTWSWAPGDSKEATERFKKWKPVGKWKALYPISTIIGMNEAFKVTECDDILEAQKDLGLFSDLCVFDLAPIEETAKLVALSP